MTIYDDRFNQNEWFVLALVSAYFIVFLLPKRFPALITLLFILFGVSTALFMDHSISVDPIDFYDVNDNSKYNIYDFLLYCGYGPFSYLVVYVFDRLKLKRQHIIFYLPTISAVSVCFEWLALQLNVFHFKNGYQIKYSFPIYLVAFTVLFAIYFKLWFKKSDN